MSRYRGFDMNEAPSFGAPILNSQVGITNPLHFNALVV